MQVPTLMRFSLAIFVAFLMICSLQENKRGIKNTELGAGTSHRAGLSVSFEENFNLGPVVQRPISATPGLNFNLGSFSFVQKHFPG